MTDLPDWLFGPGYEEGRAAARGAAGPPPEHAADAFRYATAAAYGIPETILFGRGERASIHFVDECSFSPTPTDWSELERIMTMAPEWTTDGRTLDWDADRYRKPVELAPRVARYGPQGGRTIYGGTYRGREIPLAPHPSKRARRRARGKAKS